MSAIDTAVSSTNETMPATKKAPQVYSKSAILVLSSKNEKTGNVSATYASIDGSCPKDCMHRDNGCYAQTGMVGIHSFRLNAFSKTLPRSDAREVARTEARQIRQAIRDGNNVRPMRLHVAGDCRTPAAAKILSDACQEWNNPVWTYTHAWKVVPRGNWGKVSVLASVDNKKDISAAMERGYAVAIVVEKHPDDGRAWTMPTGHRVVPCPAQTRDNVTCEKCRLCWKDGFLRETKAVISFAAHGVKKRSLTVIK